MLNICDKFPKLNMQGPFFVAGISVIILSVTIGIPEISKIN